MSAPISIRHAGAADATRWWHSLVGVLLTGCLTLGGCQGSEGPSAQVNTPGLSRIDITPPSLSLPVGQSAQLSATARDGNGQPISGAALTWSSTNTAIATVTAAGVVTGVSAGSAEVTVSSGGISARAPISVTISSPASGDVVVLPGTSFQTMVGWEASAQIGQTECNQTAYPLYKSQVLDRAVSELGINRLRLEVRNDIENTTDWDAQLLSGAITRDQWRTHRYQPINDNADPQVINSAGFKWTGFDITVREVVAPLRQRLIARGEALYLNLAFGDFEASAFEQKDNPAEYGEFMLAVFQHMQQTFGFVPDAVEIINEPDNSPGFGGTVIGQALVGAGDRLAAAGFRPAFILPSNTNAARALTYFDDAIHVPRATTYATEFAYHRYGGDDNATLAAIAARGAQYGLKTAMLELLQANVSTILGDLTIANVSSWQQYALAFCMPTDDGTAYYRIDQSVPTAPRVLLTTRARTLSQYFRYVRRGAVRISASSSQNGLIPVAFRNTNGKFVVVVSTEGAVTFTLGGLPAGAYGVNYATSSSDPRDLADVVATAAAPMTIAMPAAGVISIHQR